MAASDPPPPACGTVPSRRRTLGAAVGLAALSVAAAVAAANVRPSWSAGVVVGAALLAGSTLGLALRRPGRAVVAGLGVALAAGAGQDALVLLRAARDVDSLPVLDLARDRLPAVRPPYVAVRGVVRGGLRLSEYAVPEGAVPDQSKPPKAVVAVLTPSADDVQRSEGTVVLVRLAPDVVPEGDAVRTVRGRPVDAPPGTVDVLVEVEGGGDVDAVLVDTLDRPRATEALGPLVLALVGLGLGVGGAVGGGRAGRTG